MPPPKSSFFNKKMLANFRPPFLIVHISGHTLLPRQILRWDLRWDLIWDPTWDPRWDPTVLDGISFVMVGSHLSRRDPTCHGVISLVTAGSHLSRRDLTCHGGISLVSAGSHMKSHLISIIPPHPTFSGDIPPHHAGIPPGSRIHFLWGCQGYTLCPLRWTR